MQHIGEKHNKVAPQQTKSVRVTKPIVLSVTTCSLGEKIWRLTWKRQQHLTLLWWIAGIALRPFLCRGRRTNLTQGHFFLRTTHHLLVLSAWYHTKRCVMGKVQRLFSAHVIWLTKCSSGVLEPFLTSVLSKVQLFLIPNSSIDP